MIRKSFISICMLVALYINDAYSQKYILSIEDFKEPTGDWFETGDAKLNKDNKKLLEVVQGEGVFVNGKDGRTVHFVTAKLHKNVKLRLDFMVSEGSNSGVYLQGRYEVQILDSWGKEKVEAGDCGGIYQRWDDNRAVEKGYDGIPPLANASKPPGEWQTLFINFKAPRFNKKGVKKKNAKFKKVVLNGIVVQKNVEATGPTRSSLDNREAPLGVLMFQGDHGPIAYRNITLNR